MSGSIIQLDPNIRTTRSLVRDGVVGLVHDKKTLFLTAFSLKMNLRWTVSLPTSSAFAEIPDWRSDHLPPELIWIFERQAIVSYDAQGKQQQRIDLGDLESLAMEPDEEIGVMMATSEAFTLSICRGLNNARTSSKRTQDEKASPVHDLSPRVVRLSFAGELEWSTRLPVDVIEYGNISCIGVDTNWEQRTKPPWYPTSWKCFGHDLLIISGNRIMATFAETSSGVGCRYVLDFDTGDLKWKSKPSAGGNSSPGESGQFLIGNQGYGEFDTVLFANDQTVGSPWPTHGHNFLSNGRKYSIQLTNTVSQPQHCVELLPETEVNRVSEPLGGYYTTPPQRIGNVVVFWRADKLWRWIPGQGVQQVIQTEFGEGSFGTSMQFSEERAGFTIRHRRGKTWHNSMLIWEN